MNCKKNMKINYLLSNDKRIIEIGINGRFKQIKMTP